jgi:hypothetical protein
LKKTTIVLKKIQISGAVRAGIPAVLFIAAAQGFSGDKVKGGLQNGIHPKIKKRGFPKNSALGTASYSNT